MSDLIALQATVAARTAAIVADRPWWPCRKGCDRCCRSLAAVPVLTEPEWVLLRDAIKALVPATRHTVAMRIAALSRVSKPIRCPMLDEGSGTCLVYDARPVACRTYGLYADRGGGLYCSEIESAVRDVPDIVWGNHEAVGARLDAIGTRRSLLEWVSRDGS